MGDPMFHIRTLLIAFLLATLLPLATVGSTAPAPVQAEPAPEGPVYANGWTHRPLLEHFTGLSCPPCMNGAHPDAMRFWEEEGYAADNPWNYLEFHELNGGGEDDLMTDDSADRMRYYQPGVSGTPDLEADGGYVQLGGSHGSTADANYDDMKEAIYDSGDRDAIKMINLRVGTMYDGTMFSIKVEIDYIENNETFDPMDPLRPDTLNGLLHIFMVEDNVTAWSTTNDEFVTTHNVFREYALEGREITLEPGESLSGDSAIYADWEVPTTMIRDGEEEPIRVPVNPKNVYPLAVVFDTDDTSSGRGDGSDNNDGGDDNDGTPRALNSATPRGTAYDLGSEPPTIELREPTSVGGKIQINTHIEDDSGELTGAYVVYREAGQDDAQWSYKPLTIDGSECHGEVCTIGSGDAFAILNISDTKKAEYGIMAYDSNWTMGQSEIAIAALAEPEDDEFPTMLVGGAIAAVGLGGLFVVWARRPVEDMDMVFDEEPQPPAGE